MTKIFLSAAFLFLYISLTAQSADFVWTKSFSGTQLEKPVGISVDAGGNVYTSGQFSGSPDFDPGTGTFNMTSTGLMSTYVSKLNAQGSLLWAKQIAGNSILSKVQAWGQALCSNGDVYVTGSFEHVVDFDPGAAVVSYSAVGSDIFILKLDAQGNFLWVKTMGGTSADMANEVAVDNANNAYCTGFFIGSVDFDPGAGSYSLATNNGLPESFVLKLDASGNFGWAQQLSSTGGSIGNGIHVDATGNVISVGSFRDFVDFDPGVPTYTMNAVGTQDAYVWKLGQTGNFAWAGAMGGANVEGANNICTDVAGNMYITGFFAGSGDFDPGAGVSNLSSLGGNDIFILKLSSAGTLSWVKNVGGTGNDAVSGLHLDVNGDIYYTGIFEAMVDFNPGAATFQMSAASPNTFISKLDNAGNFSWAKSIVGPAYNGGAAITVDASTSIYTTGSFSITANFDSGVSNFSIIALGLEDAYIHKMACGNKPAVNAGSSANIICNGNSATLTATGATSYTWSPGVINNSIVVTPSPTTDFTVTGSDANGCTSSYTITQFVATCTDIFPVNPRNMEVSVFPNPTDGVLTLNMPDTYQEGCALQIINAVGQVVSKSTLDAHTKISVSELPAGIYLFAVFKDQKLLQTIKVIKN